MRMNSRMCLVLLIAAVIGIGCMPDSLLAAREEACAWLRAEVRTRERDVAHLEAYRNGLSERVRAGSTLREGELLLKELRGCGFTVVAGGSGTLRLALPAGPAGRRKELDALAASRLARAANVLARRLPDHELSVESADLARAVAAVRILHEQAGVPGPRLRAAVGGPGLLVEVRPTRIEALWEVLAATGD